MECKPDNLLECCLFFTANALARTITRLGEESFAAVGMTPSYAFLLTLAFEQPGITQKDLAARLQLAPSTVSRFVEALERKGYVSREVRGRETCVFPTESGLALRPSIREAWHGLYERYSSVLGIEQGEALTRLTADANRKLSGV
jgi:DNA-binding MarR family transcriptional regulator